MKAQLLVSQSVSHSKTPDRIFIKLPMKFWCLKDKKMPQPGKKYYLVKDPEISSKVLFFGVAKNSSIDVLFVGLYDPPYLSL